MSNTFVTPKAVSTIAQARVSYNSSITALLENFASSGAPGAANISYEGTTGLKTGMLWYKSGTSVTNGEGRLLVYDGTRFTRNGISTYKAGSLTEANAAVTAGTIRYGELVLVGTNEVYMVNSSNTGVVGVVSGTVENSSLLDGLDSSQFLRSDAPDTATADLTVSANLFVSTSLGVGTVAPSYELEVQGNVYASQDVITASDYRLKSNIVSISNATNIVSQLRGVTFTKDGSNGVGLIAQEVEQVLPDVVFQGGEFKGVAYQNIVAVLIEAVKELKAEIERLKDGQ